MTTADAKRARRLLRAFGRALGPTAPPLSTETKDESGPDDAFELYLLGLLVEAARAERYDIEWQQRNGAWGPRTLRFLRNGGEIHGSDDIAHPVLTKGGERRYEAHISVRFRGRSGVGHEADVCMLPHWYGQYRREDKRRVHWRPLCLVIEAKLYTAVELGLGEARNVVGLARELPKGCSVVLASNKNSASGRRLLGYQLRSGGLHGNLPETIKDNAQSDVLREWLRFELA